MNDFKVIKFYGNPAGIGNRYEELARLSKFAVLNNLHIDYFWNNSFDLKYKNNFLAKNLEIKEIRNLKTWPSKNFESSRFWREYISSQEIAYDEFVRLDINHPKLEIEYIGIHIRGTDRIYLGNDVPYGFQSQEELEKSIELTEKYLIEIKNTLPIAVFSEDTELKMRVEKKLNNYDLLSFPQLKNINKDYQDLLYLSKSKQIIMCSKFSTFALTAASIGRASIVHFFNNRNEELRLWNLNFQYFNNSVYAQNHNQTPKVDSLSEFVGNGTIKNFKVNSNVIKKTKVLISLNKSVYIGFEEHFKLLNNSVKVSMYYYPILFLKLKEFFQIISKDKNRKMKLNNFFKEFLKSFKIFNKRAIFISHKNKNFRTPFFVYMQEKDIEKVFNTYFDSKYCVGAIVEITNLKTSDKSFKALKELFINKLYIVEVVSQQHQIYMTIHK